MTVVPADDFARLRADRGADAPAAGEKFDLPRVWYCFHELFRGQPGPLRFAIQGDVAEHRIEWCFGLEEGQAEGDGDGTYFAHVSPEAVAGVAAELKKWPRWKVFEKLRKSHPDWLRHKQGRDEFADAYDLLVRIYETAAKQGAALMIVVC
jgi:hypothetical protein